MPKIFNLHRDYIEWDRTEDRPGWRNKDAWVGAHIGSERSVKDERVLLSRPGPILDYWDGEE